MGANAPAVAAFAASAPVRPGFTGRDCPLQRRLLGSCMNFL